MILRRLALLAFGVAAGCGVGGSVVTGESGSSVGGAAAGAGGGADSAGNHGSGGNNDGLGAAGGAAATGGGGSGAPVAAGTGGSGVAEGGSGASAGAANSVGGVGAAGGMPDVVTGAGGFSGATTGAGGGSAGSSSSCLPTDAWNPQAGACEEICSTPGASTTAPWPMAGGCPTRRGMTRFVGPKSPKVKWSTALGMDEEWSAPLVVGEGGTIYVPSVQHLWAVSPGGQAEPISTCVFQPVAIRADGGILVPRSFCEESATGALELHQGGNVAWSLDAFPDQRGAPTPMPDGGFTVSGNLPPPSDTILLRVSGTGAGVFDLALLNAGIDAAPAIRADGTMYVHAENLFAIGPAGNIDWKAPLLATVAGPVVIAHDGTIYSAGETRLFAYRPDGSILFDEDFGVPRIAGISVGPDGTIYTTGTTLLLTAPNMRSGR